MNSQYSTESPTWPIWVWMMQIPVAAILVAVFARVATADTASASLIVMGVLGIGWLVTAVAVLAVRRGRVWIVDHRTDWLLLFGSTVVALVVIDATMTWTGWVPTVADQRAQSVVYTWDPTSIRRLVPKTIMQPGQKPIEINARGFRGPNPTIEDRDGADLILFLGGSQVFGAHGHDWPTMTGETLRRHGHATVTLNAGVPGHDSTDSLIKLVTDLWTLSPDFVFVCNGWNDVKYFSRMTGGLPYRGLPPARSLTLNPDWRIHPRGIDRVLSISALYRQIRWNLASVIASEEGLAGAATAPGSEFDHFGPDQFRLNLEMIAAAATRIGARTFFCHQAMLLSGTSASGIDAGDYAIRNLRLTPEASRRAFEAVRRAVNDAGGATGASVIDMATPISARPEYFHDGIHFSKAGSQEAAQVAADAIEPFLTQPTASK